MNNKYFIIVFAVIVFGLKLLLTNYDMPDKYKPFWAALKTVFLIVFITSVVYVLSFFVVALVTKDKSKYWWENLERKRNDTGKQNLRNIYIQLLVVFIPIAVYSTLVYLAVFVSWKNILTVAIAFAIILIVNYFQNTKKHRLPQDS
jgi:hypothetical protein